MPVTIKAPNYFRGRVHEEPNKRNGSAGIIYLDDGVGMAAFYPDTPGNWNADSPPWGAKVEGYLQPANGSGNGIRPVSRFTKISPPRWRLWMGPRKPAARPRYMPEPF